jgi:hypothetical protein
VIGYLGTDIVGRGLKFFLGPELVRSRSRVSVFLFEEASLVCVACDNSLLVTGP